MLIVLHDGDSLDAGGAIYNTKYGTLGKNSSKNTYPSDILRNLAAWTRFALYRVLRVSEVVVTYLFDNGM